MKLLHQLARIEHTDHSGERPSAILRFDLGHRIMRAHFKGHPVVPASCLMQLTDELTCHLTGMSLRVVSVDNDKFSHPITTDSAIGFTITSLTPSADGCVVRATFTQGDTLCATLQHTYTIVS